jgi:cysteine sulfinate desulfinase/cysteine desulfurase-like protein
VGIAAPAGASSGVRFSLGATTTGEDVARALARIPDVVGRLRN